MLITENQLIYRILLGKKFKPLNLFKVKFNNNENIFLSLVYECRNDVDILDYFNRNGVSIFNFKKKAFTDRVLILMLVCRKQSM